MHSQLPRSRSRSRSLMATSNSKVFLADKDVNAGKDAADWKLISKQEEKTEVPCWKAPSLGLEKRFKVKDENRKDEGEHGARTPTSSDYKIPAIRRCPLAPRKPKSLKRSLPAVQRGIVVGFDVANDCLDAIFPPTPPSKKKLFAPSNPDARATINSSLQLSH